MSVSPTAIRTWSPLRDSPIEKCDRACDIAFVASSDAISSASAAASSQPHVRIVVDTKRLTARSDQVLETKVCERSASTWRGGPPTIEVCRSQIVDTSSSGNATDDGYAQNSENVISAASPFQSSSTLIAAATLPSLHSTPTISPYTRQGRIRREPAENIHDRGVEVSSDGRTVGHEPTQRVDGVDEDQSSFQRGAAVRIAPGLEVAAMARGGHHQTALPGEQSLRQELTGDVDQLVVRRVEVDHVAATEVVVDEQGSPSSGLSAPTVPVRVFGKPETRTRHVFRGA